MRIRFIKKFVLFVNISFLSSDNKLEKEERQFHIQSGKIYDIDGWENKGLVSDIKFSKNTPMEGGLVKNLNNELFEILQTSVGTKGKPTGCGGCTHK